MSNSNDGGRFPVYVLLDTSGSMGSNVDQLKSGFRDLVDQLSNDSQVCELVALCVVAFDTNVKKLIPLSRLWDISSDIQITTGGVTLTGQALKAVNEMAKNELHFVSQNGFEADYKPLLVIMTDGECTDESGNRNNNAKMQLASGVNELNLYKWGGILACGMGQYDREELLSITEHVVEIDEIKKFFKLLKTTIKASSKLATSSATAQGNAKIYSQPIQASINQMSSRNIVPSDTEFI